MKFVILFVFTSFEIDLWDFEYECKKKIGKVERRKLVKKGKIGGTPTCSRLFTLPGNLWT